MSKVIKRSFIKHSDDAVIIPDTPPVLFGQNEDGSTNVEAEKIYNAILSQAKEEGERFSEEIIKKTHEECDNLIAQAKEDALRIREEAREEGFQAGMSEKTAEIEGQLMALQQALEELRQRHALYMQDYEKELKDFALDIASKILSMKISEEPKNMASLIAHAMNTVRDADWITVQLSQELAGLVGYLEEQKLGAKSGARRIEYELMEGAPQGACLVQTPDGVVDASILTQIENLKEFFDQVE